MKKTLSLLMALILCLTLSLPAFAESTESKKLVDEPTTITVGIPQSTLITDYVENDFTKWIEEQTGLTLEFELFPTTDSQQKLEIMVNGGAKLPRR